MPAFRECRHCRKLADVTRGVKTSKSFFCTKKCQLEHHRLTPQATRMGIHVECPEDEQAATKELYAQAKEMRGTEAEFIRSRIPMHRWRFGVCTQCGQSECESHTAECVSPAAEMRLRLAHGPQLEN